MPSATVCGLRPFSCGSRWRDGHRVSRRNGGDRAIETGIQTSYPMKDTMDTAEAWVQAGYRYAFSLAHNRHDAEDLAQQAWLKLTRRYGRVKNRSMLFTTIRNAFYDQCRRAKIVGFDPLDDAPEPVAVAADETVRGDLETLLARLRPAEREALYLNAVEGYTAKEIARMTKTPRNTVLSLIHRARGKLAMAVTAEGKEVCRQGDMP